MLPKPEVNPKKLQEVGLTIWVTMEAVPPSGASSMTPIKVGALIDTGSQVSGVNEKTAQRLAGATLFERKIYTPTHGVRTEPALKCRITFFDNTSREAADFSIIKEMEPYEVLIGRDLMSEMKLDINFKSGEWTLDWA